MVTPRGLQVTQSVIMKYLEIVEHVRFHEGDSLVSETALRFREIIREKIENSVSVPRPVFDYCVARTQISRRTRTFRGLAVLRLPDLEPQAFQECYYHYSDEVCYLIGDGNVRQIIELTAESNETLRRALNLKNPPGRSGISINPRAFEICLIVREDGTPFAIGKLQLKDVTRWLDRVCRPSFDQPLRLIVDYRLLDLAAQLLLIYGESLSLMLMPKGFGAETEASPEQAMNQILVQRMLTRKTARAYTFVIATQKSYHASMRLLSPNYQIDGRVPPLPKTGTVCSLDLSQDDPLPTAIRFTLDGPHK